MLVRNLLPLRLRSDFKEPRLEIASSKNHQEIHMNKTPVQKKILKLVCRFSRVEASKMIHTGILFLCKNLQKLVELAPAKALLVVKDKGDNSTEEREIDSFLVQPSDASKVPPSKKILVDATIT
ncbi:hypothetical protein VNO77_42055 [Canavalia gladiata]|uniref:Uncharacterized protein n=1 Tax=Canavalia gladiata TaxID=3824 RepID=A0AAN9PQN9_CANGL